MRYTLAFCIGLFLGSWGCSSSSEDQAPEVVIPPSAEPSKGPNVVPKPAVATQPAAPVSACDPDRIIDLNRAAMPTNDGGYIIATEHGIRNEFVGECGGNGNEQVFKFTAASPGLWIFSIDSDDLYLDTILYARSTCDDAETEIACNDDIVPNEIIQSELTVRLDKSATIYIFADSYAGESGTFNLRVRTVPVRSDGETCDVTGQANACSDSSFCRVDQDNPGANGICSPNEAARVTNLRAYRNGDILQIGIEGVDEGGDVTRANLQLYGSPQRRCVGVDDEGQAQQTQTACNDNRGCATGQTCQLVDVVLQLNSQGADTYILQPINPVFGQTSFIFKWANEILDDFSQATRVRARFEDSQGNEGEWSEVTAIENIPTAGANGCDEDRILNTCGAGQACLDPQSTGVFSCLEVSAPTFEKLKVYYDVETNLMGIEATGKDVDRDIRGIQVEYLDEQGAVGGDAAIRFDYIDREGDDYIGYASFTAEATTAIKGVKAQTYDEERILSNALETDMFLAPTTAQAGEICDVLGAQASCADGLFCFPPSEGARNVCGQPARACPESFGTVIDLANTGYDGEWRMTGDLTGLTNQTVGSCGGGSAQAFYKFIAPEDGTYSIYVRSRAPNSDPIVYVRTHCGYGPEVPQFELACNDDISNRSYSSLVRPRLKANDEVYIVVDGAQGRSGPWRGPYNLIVRKLP
ncbi:MAG: hypothetical protein VX589_21705 [Myxococcota bacterium]|nr:hypothetical protein [Myxococcota bacterium]